MSEISKDASQNVAKSNLYFLYEIYRDYFYSYVLLNSINLLIISSALTFIYVAIKKMTIEINFMKNDIQELRSSIERSMCVKNDQISIPAFVEKYNFVKIQSIEDFKRFDSELKTNDEFANDFVSIYALLLHYNSF